MEFKVHLLTRLLALSLTFCSSYVQGTAYFTKFPDVVYVDSTSSRTARFIWDYHVDDRDSEFVSLSPKWSFFNGSDEQELIVEDKFAPIKWQWRIATNCPARFRGRVSKESTATLVISNVTTADNGMYGCTLVLPSSPKTKTAQLIFTVSPQINITGERIVMVNRGLILVCSAVGPPAPKVTWINERGKVLGQGIQSVTLKILNIAKEQNGAKYNCSATNNPTISPKSEVVTITVQSPPEFVSNAGVSKEAAGCSCDKIQIQCPIAEGSPPPRYYLFSPSNETIEAMKTGVGNMFKVKPQSGNWICGSTNGIGQDIYHKVPGKVLPDKDCKHCLSEGLSAGEIAAIVIGVLAGVAIIVVIAVVIYKKKKKSG